MFKIKQVFFSDFPFDVNGCDVLAFSGCKNKVRLNGFTCTPQATSIIDLTQDLMEIWKNMSKSSCRYAINKAERDGVKIRINQKYREFNQINKSFRHAKELWSIPKKLMDAFEKSGVLFVAEHGKQILAGQIYLTDGHTIRLQIASRRLEAHANKTLIGNANKLMIWEAIKYAKTLGMKEFDMSGILTGKDKDDPRMTITRFKLSFGGEIRTYFSYRKVYSKSYNLLQKTKRVIKVKKMI